MEFELVANYKPTGDQPKAIKELVAGFENNTPAQVLLGVTGSGKTFTMANVIKELNRPALIVSHNKTLAAQLYGEFKQFFPSNAVEYYISYYDYYQPEAYIPSTNTYIEKDLAINQEIEKLRLAATSALLSGRRDVIVVASVSCIYGIGNPDEFSRLSVMMRVGQKMTLTEFLYKLIDILYTRTTDIFSRGSFRVKGDTVDVFPAYADFAYRFFFFDNEIERILRIDPDSGSKIGSEDAVRVFPANLFVTGQDAVAEAIEQIQDDLMKQMDLFEKEGKYPEAKLLKERTEHDMEMMRELGYCSGIENYSRYFDKRNPGDRPFCLLDYFPDDFVMFIDESHVTLPQFRAMWGGDRARKVNLVEYGFRLPSALDNRPLTFDEFESLIPQALYVSATPGDYELAVSEGVVVEQIIRPTGLLDPEIEVRPTVNQIDDLIDEIDYTIKRGFRVLVTTLTKRMAEELTKYLENLSFRARYIHSEVKTMERVAILRDLRLGEFDVLVGVNLLREGLDLPEVALVAVIDADKEGFLRSARSLIQIVGRAARNAEGKVIMYAERITKSMDVAISETNRRRKIQHEYNILHGITPKTVLKSREAILEQASVLDNRKYAFEAEAETAAKEAIAVYNQKPENVEAEILRIKQEMEKAAAELDFVKAATLRDILFELKKM